jgi:hypothetical protein
MTTYDHVVQSNPNKPLTTNQQSTNNLSTNQHATHQPINTLISYNQLCDNNNNNSNNNNNNTQTTLALVNKIMLYTPQLLKSDKIMSNNKKTCKNTGSDPNDVLERFTLLATVRTIQDINVHYHNAAVIQRYALIVQQQQCNQ